MLTGTNLKFAKAHNQRIVLQTIRLHGPLPRKEIAQRTELTLQSVSNITRVLIEADMIIEADRLQEGRGAPTSLLAINPKGAYSIGLDFDREHFVGVLLDFAGNMTQRISRNVLFLMPDEAIELMVGAVHDLIEAEGISKTQVWGVGVGLPGPLGITGESVVTNVVNPVAFPGWNNVPIVDILAQRLELPVYIENNASAAAVGEMWYGEGRHIANFFYVFFGVGLGGGLVLNGRPFEGHNGNAGEIGAVRSTAGLDPTTGLLDTHLGAFFSVTDLAERLKEIGIEISRPEELADLFRRGQKELLDWLDRGIEQLAPFMLAVECLLDPEAVFLGGRYSPPMIHYIKEKLEEMLPQVRTEDQMTYPRLVVGTAGEDATALGAATLPMYNHLASGPEVLLKNASGDSLASRMAGSI